MIKSIKKIYNKDNSNKGVAMIVCVTIIAILVVFCFSLLLVTYTLYASQNKNLQSDRNAEACKSLSTSIRQELTESSEESNLYKYIRYNVLQESWPFYDEGQSDHQKEDAFRYFKLDKANSADIGGYPGEIEICMYWKQSDELMSQKVKNESGEVETRMVPATRGTRLFVVVTCRSGSQSYSITTEYRLALSRKNTSLRTVSEVPDINPFGNSINTKETWKWKYVGSE
ncbi:MAG: hypothetical protein IKO61_10830 [Lachnospiraceae bacterium]|nr:hypothetical protein [Lachnospiraceae bacterium]